MKIEKPYAELAAQAEKAVAAIKDAELRRVAFERVFDDLLSLESDLPKRKAPLANARRRKKGAGTPKGEPRLGPKGRIQELVNEGFFKQRKTLAEVKAELAKRGHHIALTSLSGPLQDLCQEKTLRREKGKGKGKRPTYAYANW